jgi:hypothetical protein
MRMTTLLLAAMLIAPAPARAQGPSTSPAAGPRLQLDSLERLAGQAVETVNLTIDPSMLKVASGLVRNNPDASSMLDDLQGIYIRSFKFDRDNVYTPDDVDAVRNQLAAPGWSRIVEVDKKADATVDGKRTASAELVQIYSWREGNASGGMAIFVAQPRELTVINIVGRIDLSRLGALQGQFGIPPLPDVTRPNR